MKPRVYVETTVVSYLVARPSRDVVLRAHQQLTERWWADERPKYDLYASPLVVQEASAGDAGMVQRRFDVLRGVPLLAVSGEAGRPSRACWSSGARSRARPRPTRFTSRRRRSMGWTTS